MASSGCPWLAQSATSSSPVPELLHEPEVLPGATGCPRLLVWSQIDESCRALVSSYSFFRAFPQVFTLPVLDVFFLSFQLQRLLIARSSSQVRSAAAAGQLLRLSEFPERRLMRARSCPIGRFVALTFDSLLVFVFTFVFFFNLLLMLVDV